MTAIAPFEQSPAVRPPDGVRLYVVGDIHGRRDLLDKMLGLVRADARTSAAARRVVVFVGDYVDRGPDAREVMDVLQAGPPPEPGWERFRWVCLRGNHEDMMDRFLASADEGPLWMMNGALPTIASYAGWGAINRILAKGGDVLAVLRRAFEEAMPPAHRTFLASLPIIHIEGDYAIVHAGVRPGVPLQQQKVADLLWIRKEFLNATGDFGKFVVHGHTPTDEPDVRSNRIGIDTGAFFTGRLTALVAEGRDRAFLHT